MHHIKVCLAALMLFTLMGGAFSITAEDYTNECGKKGSVRLVATNYLKETLKAHGEPRVSFLELQNRGHSKIVMAEVFNKKYFVKTFGGAIGNDRYHDREEFFYYFLFHALGVGPEPFFAFSEKYSPCLYMGTHAVENIEFTADIVDNEQKLRVEAMNDFFEAVFNIYDVGHHNTGFIRGHNRYVMVDFSVETETAEAYKKRLVSELIAKEIDDNGKKLPIKKITHTLSQLQYMRDFYLLRIKDHVESAMDNAERKVEEFGRKFPGAFLLRREQVDLNVYKNHIRMLMKEFEKVVLTYIKLEESKSSTETVQQERGRRTEPRVSPRGASPDRNTKTSPARESSPKRSISPPRTTRGSLPKHTSPNQSPEQRKHSVSPPRESSFKHTSLKQVPGARRGISPKR